MNEVVSLCIFDLDGTLIDSERIYLQGDIYSATKLGYQIDQDFFNHQMGISLKQFEENFYSHYGSDFPYPTFKAILNEYMDNHYKYEITPIKEGVIDFLNYLKSHGIKIAVATSTIRERALLELRSAQIPLNYFDLIICGDEIENGKPNPDIYLKVMEKLNINVENCLIFEDSNNGLKAALASLSRSIWVKDLAIVPIETQHKCYRIFDSMTEAIELVQLLNSSKS